MLSKSLNWVNSTGGPLILAEAAVGKNWKGIFGSSDQTAGMGLTDYDRACNVTEYIGTVSCGTGWVLVLGDEPMQSTILYNSINEPIVVRWVYSNGQINQSLFFQEANLEEISPRAFFRVWEGGIVLFDSSENAEDLKYDIHRFPVGLYEVTTKRLLVEDEHHFIVHKFVTAK